MRERWAVQLKAAIKMYNWLDFQEEALVSWTAQSPGKHLEDHALRLCSNIQASHRLENWRRPRRHRTSIRVQSHFLPQAVCLSFCLGSVAPNLFASSDEKTFANSSVWTDREIMCAKKGTLKRKDAKTERHQSRKPRIVDLFCVWYVVKESQKKGWVHNGSDGPENDMHLQHAGHWLDRHSLDTSGRFGTGIKEWEEMRWRDMVTWIAGQAS